MDYDPQAHHESQSKPNEISRISSLQTLRRGYSFLALQSAVNVEPASGAIMAGFRERIETLACAMSF